MVKLNGKWGFIDHAGEEAIPPQYDKVFSFEGGQAQVTLGGREFFIEKAGAGVAAADGADAGSERFLQQLKELVRELESFWLDPDLADKLVHMGEADENGLVNCLYDLTRSLDGFELELILAHDETSGIPVYGTIYGRVQADFQADKPALFQKTKSAIMPLSEEGYTIDDELSNPAMFEGVNGLAHAVIAWNDNTQVVVSLMATGDLGFYLKINY